MGCLTSLLTKFRQLTDVMIFWCDTAACWREYEATLSCNNTRITMLRDTIPMFHQDFKVKQWSIVQEWWLTKWIKAIRHDDQCGWRRWYDNQWWQSSCFSPCHNIPTRGNTSAEIPWLRISSTAVILLYLLRPLSAAKSESCHSQGLHLSNDDLQ